MKSRIIIVSLLFLFFIFLINACADKIVESTPAIGDNNSNMVKIKFSDIQSKVFDVSCALSGCHVSGAQTPNLSVNAYSAIVSKSSSTGLNYIEPGNPGNSYLYRKITGAVGISGSQMPLSGSPLPQAVIDSIKVWIEDGALNN